MRREVEEEGKAEGRGREGGGRREETKERQLTLQQQIQTGSNRAYAFRAPNNSRSLASQILRLQLIGRNMSLCP